METQTMKCNNCEYQFSGDEKVLEINNKKYSEKTLVFCGEGCWNQWFEDNEKDLIAKESEKPKTILRKRQVVDFTH